MAFWSSQTLKARLSSLVEGPPGVQVDCNAIELRVGQEIYVTPNIEQANSTTKRRLSNDESFIIPPGQFAFLLTEESVHVPTNAMAFISMKATFKMKGLVNVSGFHVDPGWNGHLIFAVFNAGPSPVHLQRGLPLFLIWYADLDFESQDHKKPSKRTDTIKPELISSLTGVDSIHEINNRMKAEIKRLEEEDKKLNDRIHDLKLTQTKISVIFGIIVAVFTFIMRDAVLAAFSPTPVAAKTDLQWDSKARTARDQSIGRPQ